MALNFLNNVNILATLPAGTEVHIDASITPQQLASLELGVPQDFRGIKCYVLKHFPDYGFVLKKTPTGDVYRLVRIDRQREVVRETDRLVPTIVVYQES